MKRWFLLLLLLALPLAQAELVEKGREWWQALFLPLADATSHLIPKRAKRELDREESMRFLLRSAQEEIALLRAEVSRLSTKTKLHWIEEKLAPSMQFLPARMVLRDPTAWGNSLWVDVGEQDNRRLECALVTKMSPVVFGNSLVGLVDRVASSRSRVRLISDPHMTLAVKTQGKRPLLIELSGAGRRRFGEEIKMRGIAYGNRAPVIGELLLTSGIDGVFPEGLDVALITAIGGERSGGVEIEARALAPLLAESAIFFVLPPRADGSTLQLKEAKALELLR